MCAVLHVWKMLFGCMYLLEAYVCVCVMCVALHVFGRGLFGCMYLLEVCVCVCVVGDVCCFVCVYIVCCLDLLGVYVFIVHMLLVLYWFYLC